MSLNSILQAFVPKDKKFFPLFNDACANLVELAECLVKAVNAESLEERAVFIKKIEDHEHIGDTISHEIFNELSKNFITPFDREDIHTLTSAIDDVADFTHGAANRITLYNLIVITQPIKELADLILKGCKDLEIGMKGLKNMKNIRNVNESIMNINEVENAADRIFDNALSDLFTNEKDPIQLIKMKEVISALETATDKLEDAANIMESIVIKFA
jgi:predicted phosphate transport protein (TIGR00153 family)